MTAPPTLNAKVRREVEPFAFPMQPVFLGVIVGLLLVVMHHSNKITTRLEAIAASLAVIEANTDRGR
jgi:hypothetical protein